MKLQGLYSAFCRFIQFFSESFAVCLGAIGLCLLVATTGAAAAEPDPGISGITVYRDPGCRCCGGWMDHLSTEGLQPQNAPVPDVDTLKQSYGIPEKLTSCHTAVIDGYVIEGHVPVADIKRLLAEQPDVAGIAVPGMPIGTPGMESGEERESFTVFSFDDQGHTDVFSQHSF